MKALTVVLITVVLSASAQSSLTEAFDKLLQPGFKANEPGGVVLVAKNGQVIYKKAFGMANMEMGVPVNDSMIFYIGSNTKQFTAVAILQLLQQNKIQLQDTVGKFFPSCHYPVSAITIQQLLSHTSGLADNTETHASKLADKINFFLSEPLEFSPGTKWSYNNRNYFVLGFIVEKLTGKSYADYIRENLFKPADMSDTYIDKEASIIKNRPSGYLFLKNTFQNRRVPVTGSMYAAGAIQSTAADMLKWNRALRSGKLLKPETLKLAFTEQVLSDGQPAHYGLGWRLDELHGSYGIHHGGLVEGYTSETLYLPQEDVYVVILLNSEMSPIPILALSRMIGGLVIGKPYNFTETAIDRNGLKKFVGLYENKFGELVNIDEQNGQLIFQRPNGGVNNLHYAGNNEFFFEKDYFRTEFTADAAGKIKSLVLSKVDILPIEWFKTQKPLLKLSPVKAPDSLLNQYTGKYFLSTGDTITIDREGPSLYCQPANQARQLLASENNIMYYSLKEDLRIEFIKAPATSALGLLLVRDNKSKKYLKL